jgi:hypothetical protein
MNRPIITDSSVKGRFDVLIGNRIFREVVKIFIDTRSIGDVKKYAEESTLLDIQPMYSTDGELWGVDLYLTKELW